MVKNVRFGQEAVALENGSLNVSVHRGQRVKFVREVRRVLWGVTETTLNECASSVKIANGAKGYNLGSSSLMEAILKNQLRHVSLAVSFTSSTVNESEGGNREA